VPSEELKITPFELPEADALLAVETGPGAHQFITNARSQPAGLSFDPSDLQLRS
jgi:hypothetical protein